MKLPATLGGAMDTAGGLNMRQYGLRQYGPQCVCVEGGCRLRWQHVAVLHVVSGTLMGSMGRALQTNPFAQYTLGWVRSVLAEWDSGSMSV